MTEHKNEDGETYEQFIAKLTPEEKAKCIKDANLDIEQSKFLSAISNLMFLLAMHTKLKLGDTCALTEEDIQTQVAESMKRLGGSGAGIFGPMLDKLTDQIIKESPGMLLALASKTVRHQQQIMDVGVRALKGANVESVIDMLLNAMSDHEHDAEGNCIHPTHHKAGNA